MSVFHTEPTLHFQMSLLSLDMLPLYYSLVATKIQRIHLQAMHWVVLPFLICFVVTCSIGVLQLHDSSAPSRSQLLTLFLSVNEVVLTEVMKNDWLTFPM